MNAWTVLDGIKEELNVSAVNRLRTGKDALKSHMGGYFLHYICCRRNSSDSF
jgi:hypothetical protein